ncbi:MAG: DNA polymerase I, partial [Rhodospirillaceae bacterium]|nr:DNA polymerase I [Rhodospirillaceae bacterium]
LALSVEPGRAGYLPLAHGADGGQGALALEAAPAVPEVARAPDRALARLKSLLEAPGVLKVGHGIKELMAVFARHGIALDPIDDTQLISYVLAGGAHGHDCDALVELHLGIKCRSYDSVVGIGRSRQRFDALAPDAVRDHAAESADMALRLHRLLKPRLVQERLVSVYETIERPLAAVVAEMETHGVKVDGDELRRLSDDFARRLAALEAEIHRLAGHPFNIGSPKQLGEVLFDEMGLGGGRKGKTGAYATGADILEELAAQGHDLPARVLEWRELAKLKSTYTDALLAEIDPRTGRVHTSFELAATSTGRLSSNNPNLQNIPIRTEEGRRIRRAFIAEPGWLLLSVDYSQIELRLAAHMADLAALKEAFRRGEDIHAATAAQVFGVPAEGMDPAVRRRAKAINFGIIYGISPFGLAQQLGIPQAEAKAYIDAYLARYPGIRDYMERTKRFCRERGYVLTLFGRRCHVPGINDANPSRRGNAERAAINAPLQGSAADIIKRAMVRVPPALRRAGLKARMLLQVHDELLFEVPEDEAERTAALVKQVMEGAALPAVSLSVPLVAETGLGRSWAEAH